MTFRIARERDSAVRSAKLTPERVATIRMALARGVAPATIARELTKAGTPISRQAVCDLRDGKTWKEKG